MNIHNRLKEISEYYNLSANELGAAMGVSGVMAGKYMNGISEPGYQTIVSLLQKYPAISKQWFLFGDGEMLGAEYSQGRPKYIEDWILQIDTRLKKIEGPNTEFKPATYTYKDEKNKTNKTK